MKPRILLVDDDKTLLALGQSVLSKANFEITVANNGEDALSEYLQQAPDIVLLDVMMPKLDGFCVCSRIRQLPNGSNVPILMMTGLNDIDSIEKAYQVGATDFVTKPVNWKILFHRLQYIFRGSQAMNQLYQAMSTLRENESRLSHAQRLAKIGDWSYDYQQGKFYCADFIFKSLGLNGTHHPEYIEDFIHYIHPDDREQVIEHVQSAIKNHLPMNLETRVVTENSEEKIIFLETDFTDYQNKTRLTGIIQDVTERRKAEDEIKRLAYYDKITGLPNLRYFLENSDQIINSARGKKKLCAVIYLHIENYRKISDSLGQDHVNEFLSMIAGKLTNVIRHIRSATHNELLNLLNPSVIHNGEYALLLSGLANSTELVRDLETILREVNQKVQVMDFEFVPKFEVGVSVFPEDGNDIQTLFKNAEIARNQITSNFDKYQFYSEAMREQVAEHISIETHLHRAIEERQLSAHYQPKYHIQEQRILSMELLVRWFNDELGNLRPDQFIPIAEDTGLILPLGEWAIRSACEQAKYWCSKGLEDISIAVNLSAKNFWDRNLLDYIKSTVEEVGVPGQHLEVEITESVLLDDIDKAAKTLKELSDFGISVSIDDFGTGYSSLAYLKRLPIHTLKIDRSFIQDITQNPESLSITKAILALAQSMNMNVVAEGVETEQQFQLLADMGCDEIQGWLYCKALPADELMEKIIKQDFPQLSFIKS